MAYIYNDEDNAPMNDDSRRFGVCPWCKQQKWTEWVLGKVKGSDRLWSGFVCRDCLNKAQKED